MRTPIEDVAGAIASDPSAQLVRLPSTGHSSITTDASGCALSLAKRFLLFDATDGKCVHEPPATPVRMPPPLSVRAVNPLRGKCKSKHRAHHGASSARHGSSCKTALKSTTAAYLTFRDVLENAMAGFAEEGGGLRSGSWNLDFNYDENDNETFSINYDHVEYVPGVTIDGQIDLTEFPRVEGSLFVQSESGSGYFELHGKAAYDRNDDRLSMHATFGRQRVTIGPQPAGAARRGHNHGKIRDWRRKPALGWTITTPEEWANANQRIFDPAWPKLLRAK